jgi:hypothetical protein
MTVVKKEQEKANIYTQETRGRAANGRPTTVQGWGDGTRTNQGALCLPLGEDFIEQCQDFWNVELYIFQIKEMLVVLLLEAEVVRIPTTRIENQRRTFSSRSSILRSISRIAFSRPL